MKKFLLILALTLIAISMQAATISTSNCPVNNVPPNGSVVCPGLGTAAGFTNLVLQMTYGLDLTGNPLTLTGTMTVSVDNPLTAWDITNAVVSNLTRPVIVVNPGVAITAANLAASFAAAFNSTVTASAFTWTASDGNVSIVFTLSGDPVTTGVPEPTTTCLFGLGMLAVGLVSRKFMK